jgi:deoxyxylulose-5-phosphate synthase
MTSSLLDQVTQSYRRSRGEEGTRPAGQSRAQAHRAPTARAIGRIVEKKMAEEKFSDNLLRAIAAELHFLNGMTAAREMFGKSYFSLGLSEKIAVDQAAVG